MISQDQSARSEKDLSKSAVLSGIPDVLRGMSRVQRLSFALRENAESAYAYANCYVAPAGPYNRDDTKPLEYGFPFILYDMRTR